MDDVTVQMPDRFQERIDLMAARRGLQDADRTLPNGSGARKKIARDRRKRWRQRVKAELEAKADW